MDNKLIIITASMDAKINIGYALIRIFLGIALSIRGWLILSNPDFIIRMGIDREFYMWISLIGMIHLLGGILLCLGFFTRLGALIQIPILFSASFFVLEHTTLMMGGQSVELAILVLVLLCIYFVFGPGTLSIRNYFAKNNHQISNKV
jgi:putative oxidoreductase